MRWSRWAVIGKAIDDWDKTARLCVILVVMALCTVIAAAGVLGLLVLIHPHGLAALIVHSIGWAGR